jgi:hypothetical protein
MTVDEAKEILGADAECYADAELAKILETLEAIAALAVEMAER